LCLFYSLRSNDKVIEAHEQAEDFKESGVKRIAFLIRSNRNNHNRTKTKDSTSKDNSCSTRTRKVCPSSNMGTNSSSKDNQIRAYTKGNTQKNNSRSKARKECPSPQRGTNPNYRRPSNCRSSFGRLSNRRSSLGRSSYDMFPMCRG